MFEHFTPRHIPPLLLATTITLGGMMPFLRGPEAALLEFGFPKSIASARAAWPVIKTGSARASAMGIAIWGMYLGGHLEAVDILIGSMAWIGVVDGVVCAREGAPGSAAFRMGSTGMVALWGLLGMTGGRYV
ncbi:hypothetical protein BS50DRAFT_631370 [Corynespora cassiicola Philippines]|uniref:Integral membrane protein n=1 Tax=Corynespora cassiicola Philippines TaxID=1448308 RepID=A0A2T2P159_CORCC|nr:hypothetical protein BS50DRAFT_631370 [Corynespora cassiicola Philippines]